MLELDKKSLLRFDDLHVNFPTPEGVVNAVKGVSYEVRHGETVGVVGESGSGKSVTAMSALRLNDMAGALIPKGSITLNSERLGVLDIAKADSRTIREIRGREIAMIFQEPMTSLNPVLTIGAQLVEPLMEHRDLSLGEARTRVLELLQRVRMPDPETKLDQYPHHLSGGMRQRAMIAMALCCAPSLLIADEPTTALDVTIQSQILDLIKDLQEEIGMAVMFITHDMGVIAEMADRVVVMYQGEIMEQGPVEQIFHAPQNEYTKRLIAAVPRIGSMAGKTHPERFPLVGA